MRINESQTIVLTMCVKPRNISILNKVTSQLVSKVTYFLAKANFYTHWSLGVNFQTQCPKHIHTMFCMLRLMALISAILFPIGPVSSRTSRWEAEAVLTLQAMVCLHVNTF